MRFLLASSALLLVASAASPAVAAPQGWQDFGARTGVIRCESIDGRVRECHTGGGRVMLERQISRSPCIEGRSWGQSRNAIWVAQGCRADFRVVGRGGNHYDGDYYGRDRYDGNYGGGHAGRTFRCESHDGRMQRCPSGVRGRVELVRQLSRGPCIEGRTWGSDYNGVWVTQGCRAEFSTSMRGNAYGYGNGNAYGYGSGGGNAYGNPYAGARTFRCESIDGRTRECSANTRAGVQLVRQLSRGACIQGQTWGYRRNGVWVSQGCRAEFRSY